MKELIYGRLLLTAAERAADAVTAVEGEVHESLGTHVDRSVRLAGALRGLLRPGGSFAVLATNTRHYTNLWHAALLGGGRINPLNVRLATAELATVLRDSGSEVLVVDVTFAALAAQLRHEVPAIRHVVAMDHATEGADLTLGELAGQSDGSLPPEPDEDDPVWVVYTGGTTGRPKGVVHTQRAAVLTTYRLNQLFDFARPGNVFLSVMPLFHLGACPTVLGMPAAARPTVYASFVPATISDLIARHHITQTAMAPALLGAILAAPGFDPAKLASLRLIGYGGSPMPPALQESLVGFAPQAELLQVFGMTESCGIFTALTPDDHRAGGERLRSVGRPLPGNRVRIVDLEDPAQAVDGVGEVAVQSGSMLLEYHENPAETAQALSTGWYRTGDVGYLDEEGYLYLVDRAIDMIVTGAENVYSVEIEQAIGSHPAVRQVAVIGIPDERWGEAVHAIVVAEPESQLDSTTIIEHARKSIAGYKAPKSVEFRADPLPLSAAGKVLKRELRARYWVDRDRAVN